MALKYPNPRPGSVVNATVAVGAAITGDKIVPDFGPQTIVGNRLNLGVGSATTGIWAGVANDKALMTLSAANVVAIGLGTAGVTLAHDVTISAGCDLKMASNRSIYFNSVLVLQYTTAGKTVLGTATDGEVQYAGSARFTWNTTGISFYPGVTPVARRTAAAVATDLATVIALANDLRTGIINLGLFAA